MEKVGATDPELVAGLRNEEANLMQQLQSCMTNGEKTAGDRQASGFSISCKARSSRS